MAGRVSRFWWLFRRAWVLAYEENCLGISKGAAYSALLAFFPVLTTLATMLVQARARAVSQVLSSLLSEVVPPGSEQLVLDQFVVRGQRPASLLVIAALVSLWGASGVMMSLMEGFNAVYHIPMRRSFLRQRAVAALLVVAAIVPALGASALILFGARTEQALLRWLAVLGPAEPLAGGVLLFGELARYVAALGAIVVVMAVLYRLGPNRPQRWRDVWAGALLATALWLAATSLFGWYVRNIAGYNVLYGSIGAVIALIVWMYVLGVIAIAGCAFNVERERIRIAGG